MSSVPAITTRVGHTGADELRFYGHKVFAELLGHCDVGQMLLLGITGRLLTRDDITTIDDIVTAMTSTDPRLWPFKVTRLAASRGVAAYGVAATLVAGEGGMYGTNRLKGAAEWLVKLKDRSGTADPTDDEISRLLDESGQSFSVLYRARDERFEALLGQLAKRGYHERPFTRLCRHAVRVVRERRQLEPHASLAVAASLLDLGLSPDEIAMFSLVFMFHDALANAVEGAAQQPAVLQELPGDALHYVGVAARLSPRAREGKG